MTSLIRFLSFLAILFPLLANSTESTLQPTLDDVINSGINKVVEKVKETKGKIAIMDFPSLDNKATGLSAYISNKVGNRFIDSGRQVVDRSTLEKVISEQKLQQNALVDASTAAKVGKLAGAGVFIIGNYTKTETKFTLTIRALSVELGQFIPGAVSEEIIRNLSEEFNKEVNELLNIKVENKTSSIDQPNNNQQIIINGLSKEELAFNKKVCAIVKGDRSLGRVVKAAYDSQAISLEELKSNQCIWELADNSGEAYVARKIGDWGFRVGCRYHVGEYVKGKNLGDPRFESWLYTGEPFPGMEKCIDKLNWWTVK